MGNRTINLIITDLNVNGGLTERGFLKALQSFDCPPGLLEAILKIDTGICVLSYPEEICLKQAFLEKTESGYIADWLEEDERVTSDTPIFYEYTQPRMDKGIGLYGGIGLQSVLRPGDQEDYRQFHEILEATASPIMRDRSRFKPVSAIVDCTWSPAVPELLREFGYDVRLHEYFDPRNPWAKKR